MSGNLFKTKCKPILSEVAPQVQQQILNELYMANKNIECLPIGSVGKKPLNEYNGDIDIAIKCKDVEQLKKIIEHTFYYLDTITVESLYIVSIAFPYQIKNESEIKYVQCDFVVMWDKDYTSFRYYCPNYINKESKYKTGAKIMFANMILNHTSDRNANLPANQYGKFNFLPTGLFRTIIDIDKKLYTSEFITINVQQIVDMCFKDGDSKHFNTVETLWQAIHSTNFKYPDEVKFIEKNWFINCWRKGWTSIIPEKFELQYWTNDEIWQFIKKQDKINKINRFLQLGNEY